jgi:SNF2 family DNA or RNA helicase
LFICSVEEGILALQLKKIRLADDVLGGAKQRGANKLTLDELKSLFGVE